MPRNIEIKARIENLYGLIEKITKLADQVPFEFAQDDTFFKCQNGRLKLRTFLSGKAELIFYRRPNQTGPKESDYVIYPVSNPDMMRQVLSLAYGQVGQVRKLRTLFLIGRTRVHLDRVDGLGNFVELEVVLQDSEPSETGRSIANDLLAKLGILPAQLVEKAYVDLLNELALSGPK